ncbi:unnamed protein product [Adineta steineri]|uniref:Uncharacterized protein n=1 Tax=Adineta steineri TaxID=433720 RepID=A0A814M8J7_9BILA|nr:unnamed protein product [Adineta steineri]CAF1076243.1 unnamed protein product [Adineta steineri]
MNIYIRKSIQNGIQQRSQRFRFPVARYTRREFPLPGPFISFMPWIPIFADRLTRQTIIYSSTGIYILPPLINFYGKMFSIAELIMSGYASLVDGGSQPTGPINMIPYFQPRPLYGTSIPRINRLTGGFVGGIKTDYKSFNIRKYSRTRINIDTSSETEEKNEDENQTPSYSQESNNKPKPQRRIRPQSRSRSNSPCQNKQDSIYDYIVVGSGAGGATIATRLALNNFKVLLIEAGPDYDDGITRTPRFWQLAQLNPNITVNFNPYLYSEKDNITIQYPRGVTLGGSAEINVMVAMTANPLEWDYIEKVTGDSNWNYKNIENKYEKLADDCQYCKNDDDNRHGWLNTTVSVYQDLLPLSETNPLFNHLINDIKTKVKFNGNINEKNDYDSYFYSPESVTKETGIRSSSYKRIKNVQNIKKSNLHVCTNTFVTKLIIDPQKKEACGVEYINGSYLYKASSLASQTLNSNQLKKSSIYAKREIIVSGGQWMTPQLLQLSGIGDKDLLKKFGIPVIQGLPGVGINQQDRSEGVYVVKLKENVNIAGIRSINCTYNATPDDPCLIDYMKHPQTALYASNSVLFAILHSTQPKLPKLPDTALVFLPVRFTGFRENWVNESLEYPVGTYLSVIINLAHVDNNVGSVRIQSTNAFDTPLIQLKHFSGPNKQIDLSRTIQSIRYLRTLLFNSSFSQYIDYEELPGDQVQTDKQLTKIGNTKTDSFAVLNSKAQVKGIKNLRVCDISIFPKIPGYYPLIPIITACEKIADDIIKHAKY